MRCCYPSPSSEPSRQQKNRQRLKGSAGATAEHLVSCVERGFQMVLSGGTVRVTGSVRVTVIGYFYMHK